MNKDIKAQWTAALRSGEFEQGVGMLETSDGKFCCLGVLCMLAVRAGIAQRQDIDGRIMYGEGPEDPETSIGYLPLSVRNWAELPDKNPVIPHHSETLADMNVIPHHSKTLAGMNDKGCTFSEIADHIERYL